MADSWMYDAFPLKRADSTTKGDDYQYVIQSMDAALRHTFGFPAGVAITPPFSISESGDVEILQTLSIGSAVPINEIVDAITTSAEDADDSRMANVTSIRAFTAEYIDDYMTTQGLFVLKAGDTMTGALVADGGITATTALSLSKAVFADEPTLAAGIALQGYGGADLIQYDAAVVVGDSLETLEMTGAGGRPLYKGQNVALVSDISGSIPGMDYVPAAGGTFDGLIDFDAGLMINYGNSIDMEWNVGGSSFTLAEVADDALGDVVFAAGDSTFDFLGDVLATAFDLDVGTRENILQWTSGYIQLGLVTEGVKLVGDETRPLYNAVELALLSDTSGGILAGSGITFSPPNGDTTISITEGGIVALHMPTPQAEGQYLRLDDGPELYWSDPDIVAGDGIDVDINGTTKQVTVSIDDDGVTEVKILNDAVTNDKLADNAVDYMELAADRGISSSVDGLYTLVVNTVGAPSSVGTLGWQKAGADGIVGTLEAIDAEQETASESYVEIINVTNGPYVITRVEYVTLTSPQTADIQVIIDGSTTLDIAVLDSAKILIGNTEDAVYDFPFFAKTSVEIKHKRNGGAGNIKCEVGLMRMG